MARKMLFIALNEFNDELLREKAKSLNLLHIKRMLTMKSSQTHTNDTYESDFLEPWVQWVSIQTGTSSEKHGIKHLGDIPGLQHKQIWEKLSDLGITSGIWGAMNAHRGSADFCQFFLPDPWTAQEKAYPKELNQCLEPLRYFSLNYTGIRPLQALKEAGRLIKFTLHHKGLSVLTQELFYFGKGFLHFGPKPFLFIGLLEALSGHLFLSYAKKYQPGYLQIFLNLLAHTQHHQWRPDSRALDYSFRLIDRILGRLFTSLEKERVLLIANALSQKNSFTDEPWILYRPHDPLQFLKNMGIKAERVEPHMTHDAHIFFARKEDCLAAKELLEKAHMGSKKIFLVESYKDEPLKLFYRIIFTDPVSQDDCFMLGGKSWPFSQAFKAIVQRTGKHIPQGTIYSSLDLPEKGLFNHEIFQIIENYFAT